MGLQGFRDNKQNTFIYIIFAVIIVVFVFAFGMPSADNIFGGNKTKLVATVGSHEIDSDLVRNMILQRYDDRILQSPLRVEYEREMAYSLATIYMLADEARATGLRVSEEEWIDYLTNWESGNADVFSFLRKNTFSEQNYQYALQRMGMSSRAYRAYKECELLARRYLSIMQASIAVSDEMLWTLFSEAGKTADLEVIQLTPSDVKATMKKLTEDEIQNYLAANTAEIQKYYDEHISDYTTPEKVKLQTITIQKDYSKLTNIGAKTLKNLTAAERFAIARRQLIDEKGEFAQVFADYDESIVKLNEGLSSLQSVDNLAPELQAALEGKALNDNFTAELADRYLIVKLVERADKVVTPFDDVKVAIATKRLNDARVKARTDEVASQILSSVKSGSSLEDALKSTLYAGILESEPVVEPAVTDVDVDQDANVAADTTAEADVAVAAADVAVEAVEAIAAPEPVAAPAVVADAIVIPESLRLNVKKLDHINLTTGDIEGVGSSNELVNAIRVSEPGSTLDQTFAIARAFSEQTDTVIVRVVAKTDASQEEFDKQKDTLRTLYLNNKTLQLIGNTSKILYLNGSRGLWLQKKLDSAISKGQVVINENYFKALSERMTKQAAEKSEG